MLDVTVKTLDSRSRPITGLADDITVRQFKETIQDSVNIPADRQRLIYQGRVLQDDAKLDASGDINGKVLHLVERLPSANPPQPTPAERAREPPRTSRPPTSQQNAQTSILGPFGIPGPGGAGNIPGQFVQQMLQQALGGAVVRGTVRRPNAPGGDSGGAEIQIRIEGHAGSQPSQTSTAGPRQTTTTVQSQRTILQPRHSHVHARPQAPPQSFSRNHLLQMQCMVDTFEDVVKHFEAGNYEEADKRVSKTPATSCPATAAPSTSQAIPSAGTSDVPTSDSNASVGPSVSSSSTPPRTNPRLPELGILMRRFVALEERFLPFLSEYIDFLQTDPAFQSQESPEFKIASKRISAVIKTQKLLSNIHRNCSMIVIPISETPPRPMFAQDRSSRNRGGLPQQPRMPHHHHHVPPSARVMHGQVRVPMLVGPLPGPPGVVGGPMTAGVILNQIPPHQSGLYGHPPSSTNTPTSTSTTASATSAASTPASSTQPAMMSIPSNLPMMFPSSEYRVHVTANVEPRININVAVPGLPSLDEEVLVGDNMEEAATPPSGQDTIQVGDVNVSQIPNIPGVSSDQMQRIVESVRSSVQRIMGATGGRTTLGSTGVVEVNGIPDNMQDVIPMEVAQIIGDTVQDIVLHQLQTDHEQRAMSGSNAPTSTAAEASATSSVTRADAQSAANPVSLSQGSTVTTSTTATAPSPQQQGSHNPLVQLMEEVSSGSFGSVTDALANSLGGSNVQSGAIIEGCAGPNQTRLPEIRRTQNCVNDLVRGQGYPREMMELTGHETILSLLMFLCGELFTVTDCMAFIAGSSEPARRLRDPLRSIVTQCWFGGREPNREQIESEVERHSELARPVMEEVFRSATPKSPDISVIESNLSLYRFVLRKLLQLMYIHDSERFHNEILGHMMDSYALALNLNSHILRGTEQAVTSLMSDYLSSAIGSFTMGESSAASDPMADQMRHFISSNMMPFARSRPISQDQIDQFVMNVPATTNMSPDPSAESAPPPQQEERHNGRGLWLDNIHGIFTALTASSFWQPTPPAVEQPPPVEPIEPAAVEQDADEPMQAEDSVAVEGGDAEVDWRLTVPNEWVPVMEIDIERQKNLAERQEPLSEAYLSGTPASKRRKL